MRRKKDACCLLDALISFWSKHRRERVCSNRLHDFVFTTPFSSFVNRVHVRPGGSTYSATDSIEPLAARCLTECEKVLGIMRNLSLELHVSKDQNTYCRRSFAIFKKISHGANSLKPCFKRVKTTEQSEWWGLYQSRWSDAKPFMGLKYIQAMNFCRQQPRYLVREVWIFYQRRLRIGVIRKWDSHKNSLGL